MTACFSRILCLSLLMVFSGILAMPAFAASGGVAGTSKDLNSTSFKFDPNEISPSTRGYSAGSGNISDMIRRIAQFLLVLVSVGVTIGIVIGGLIMTTSAGNSDRVTKGRSIIMHNLQALVVALSAYAIVQFVIWILWTTPK